MMLRLLDWLITRLAKHLILLTVEHRCVEMPEKPNSIRGFHEKLLNLAAQLDENTSAGRIVMTVDLRTGVTVPSIGSVVADIVKFGPCEPQHH